MKATMYVKDISPYFLPLSLQMLRADTLSEPQRMSLLLAHSSEIEKKNKCPGLYPKYKEIRLKIQ